MRKLLLTSTALIVLTAPAYAEAILHVNDIQGSAGPSDPVLISSQTQFFIEQTNNSLIPAPLTVYILDFPGGIVPTISSALLNGIPPSAPIAGPVQLTDFTSGDFYKDYLGCGTCNGSISFANIQTAYLANFGVNAPSSFDVYKFTIDGGFDDKSFYEINGVFGKGSIIAPFADTDITTSWTNTGLITGGDVCLGCGPTTQGVPGPIVGAGLPGLIAACMMMLGLGRYRRNRKNEGAFA